MSFPISPINGQTAVVNGISYSYATATLAWTKVAGVVTATNSLLITGNAGSTSTTTGALQVVGGVGVGGGLFVGGVSTFTNIVIHSNTTGVSSTTTGALQVAGGIGVGGGLFVGGTVTATTLVATGAAGIGTSLTVGTTLYTANLQETQNNGLQIYVPYNSVTPTVSFYGGIGAKLVVNTSAQGLYPSIANGYSLGTAALPFGATFVSSATISSTASTVSTTTGALQVAGGAGIGGGLVVGGTVTATSFVGAFSGSITGVSTTATNIQNGTSGALPYQSAPGITAFATISTAGYVLQSSGTIPQWVNIGPTVLNDISGQFDGSKTVFNLMLDQTVINTIVDSKDLEVVIGGQRLAPYVDILPYPWLTPYDSFKGFRVVGSTGQLVIYNAPYRGDTAVLTLRQQTTTRQKRKYPYSANTIAFGD